MWKNIAINKWVYEINALNQSSTKLLEANGDSSKNCIIHIYCENLEITNHALLLSAVNFIWFWDRVMLVCMRDRYLSSIVRREEKYDNLKWFLAFLLQFLLLLYEGMPLAFESFLTLLLQFSLSNCSTSKKNTNCDKHILILQTHT